MVVLEEAKNVWRVERALANHTGRIFGHDKVDMRRGCDLQCPHQVYQLDQRLPQSAVLAVLGQNRRLSFVIEEDCGNGRSQVTTQTGADRAPHP